MVSVTIGHGTSLMAPSIIRNAITRAERMRPAQRSGLEAGRVSVTVMTNPRCLEWWLGFKTNEAGGSRQESGIFYFVMAGLARAIPLLVRPDKEGGALGQ